MRKLYISPEMEVIKFDTIDVITTSGLDELIKDNVDGSQSDDGWTPIY